MKLFTYFLSLLFIAPSISHAQPKVYIKSSGNMFSTMYLVKNKKEIEFSNMSSSNELLDLFKDNEVSYQHIKNYQRNSTKFHISLLGGLGLAIVYLLSNRDNYSPGIYWGIFGTGLVGSLYYGAEASSSFYK